VLFTAAWGLTADWILMLAAMMGPMLAVPIRHVLQRNFVRRRRRAVVLFVSAYVGVWMVAGTILTGLQIALSRSVNAAALIALIVGLTILWQCSPWKQVCLNRGHGHTPLPPFGAAADLGTLRFGAVHGLWCVGSCWALMLVPAAFPSEHLLAMALVTVWLLGERLERPFLPCWRIRAPLKAVSIARVQICNLRSLRRSA
jgi:predicted metal-binding membrane protein